MTDIPLLHLDSHKDYYGDVAIGFKSEKIYEQFNPVLYIKKSGIVKSAIEFKQSTQKITDLSKVDMDEESAILNRWTKNEDGSWTMPVTDVSYGENTKLEKFLLNHIKISAFSDNPGESFYQEKEWRKNADFHFESDDIEAIIIPSEYVHTVNKLLSGINTVRGVSILTWDLIAKS